MPMSQHEDILVFSRASIGHKSLLKDKRMFYEPRNLTEVNQMVKSYGHKYGRVYMPRPSHKEIYKKTHTGYPSDVLIYDKDAKCVHPNQKPVDLLKFLIETYTNEGDTVLDFAMGSGSTGVACKKLNRDFIGIEIDEKYYNIAKERINNEN